MTKMMTAMVATFVLCAAPACKKQETAAAAPDANANAAAASNAMAANDPIDGTWKADLASVQMDEKPTVELLKDGTYSCSTCTPPLTTKADGAFHPVTGHPYYDSVSVKVVDDKTVKTVRRKGETETSEVTVTVAPDNKSRSFEFKDMSVANAPPVTGKGSDTRVAPAPAGAHAISGSWKTAKYDNVSDEGLTFTLDAEGDMLHMSSPSGTSYDAKFGGPAVAIKGDTGGTTVAVERLSPDSFRETASRGGKVVNVSTYTVADGKLNAVSEDKLQGSTMKYSAVKQ